jgi:hypothetical protein
LLSILSKLQRLAKFSLGDWVLLIQLVAFVLLLEVALRLFSLPSLVRLLSSGAQSRWGGRFPLFHGRAERHRLFDLSALAARIVRGPECCLPRSLLLFWLFSVRREPVTLLVGVRKDAGALRAHAWVETQEGPAVGGHPEGDAFQPLIRFSREGI